jgi:hypothetical protein
LLVIVHLGAGMPDMAKIALGEGGVGVLLISHLAMIGVVMVRLKRSPE